MRRPLTCLCLLSLASPVLADTLVLLDGRRIEGTIANREAPREQLLSGPAISILIEERGELLRFELSEIDYVLFETEQGVQPWDPASLVELNRAYQQSLRTKRPNRGDAQTLTAVGLLATVVGALYKFGEAEYPDTKSHYTDLNYALVAGGLVAATVGIGIHVWLRFGQEQALQVGYARQF